MPQRIEPGKQWNFCLAILLISLHHRWQPNSPDLNLVDYQVWSALQQRVYQSRIHNVEQLEKTLIEEWHHFPQGIIDYAIKQWHVRLRACS